MGQQSVLQAYESAYRVHHVRPGCSVIECLWLVFDCKTSLPELVP